MSNSTHLQLPYLAPAQAQKHVTVNESLSTLDRVVQLSVISATTAAEPASPGDGDVYILPAGKTGATWGAMTDLALAHYLDGAWAQITPREGWRAWVKDTNTLVRRTASGWSALASPLSAAIADVGANGFIARTGASAASARTLTAGIGVTISQGDGAMGDPSIALNLSDALTWTGAQALNGGLTLGGPIAPATDNAVSLGDAAHRFTTVYAATGAINTSDAREKTALAPLPESVLRAGRTLIDHIGVFQWRDAIARKGETGARLHIGLTAQAVAAAFSEVGEDPHRWGMLCVDHETGRQGLRLDQALLLMIAAMR